MISVLWPSFQSTIVQGYLSHSLSLVSADACPSCPEPSPIEHGRVSAPNRSLFAEIEYMCDEGYVLVGNKNRVCEESGEWSLEEPICWSKSLLVV